MPSYSFGTRSGSNRVGFQTRTWSIGNPTISGITQDINGNRPILVVDVQAGIIGQANGSPWVSVEISGNGISTTSSRVSVGNTTSTGSTYTPPAVTFDVPNALASNVTGAFSLTSRAFVSSTGSGTNGNLETSTTTDDIRIALSGGATQFWGLINYRMVPTAPGNPTVSVSGTTFSVSWTAPSSNGDTAITSYTVERSQSSTFSSGVTTSSHTLTSASFTLSGTWYFRVYATNATGNSQRSGTGSGTSGSPPTWTTTTFNEIARVGSTFSSSVTATGTGTITYALGSGSLPSNVTVSSNGTISGSVSAGASQSFTFAVDASNAAGTTRSNNFTINRRQALPVWTDNTLSTDLRVGISYSDSVAASNASSYSVSGLPSGGLSFNTSTGTVSGTPTGTSTISFTITASNSDGDSINQAFSLTPKPRLPVWTDNTLSTTTIKVGQEYTDGVSADFATAYAVHSGSLPPGITLDTTFGSLSGEPTTVGTYNFVLRARNAIDERIFTSTLTITVEPAGSGKVWNGTAWVQAPFRVWNGSTWVESPAKVWNGSAWVDPIA